MKRGNGDVREKPSSWSHKPPSSPVYSVSTEKHRDGVFSGDLRMGGI